MRTLRPDTESSTPTTMFNLGGFHQPPKAATFCWLPGYMVHEANKALEESRQGGRFRRSGRPLLSAVRRGELSTSRTPRAVAS